MCITASCTVCYVLCIAHSVQCILILYYVLCVVHYALLYVVYSIVYSVSYKSVMYCVLCILYYVLYVVYRNDDEKLTRVIRERDERM